MLGHPSGGERIADLVLHGLARKAGDAQQSAMISGAEDRELRTPLQRLPRPSDGPLPQCLWDCGIERRRQVFERRLDLGKRLLWTGGEPVPLPLKAVDLTPGDGSPAEVICGTARRSAVLTASASR